jgi:hypothetical protein
MVAGRPEYTNAPSLLLQLRHTSIQTVVDIPMRTETEHTIYLKDYAPSPYRISHVDLDFRIGSDTTRVRALLTVEPREGTVAGTPLARR